MLDKMEVDCQNSKIRDHLKFGIDLINCYNAQEGKEREVYTSPDSLPFLKPETLVSLLDLVPHITAMCVHNQTIAKKNQGDYVVKIKDIIANKLSKWNDTITYRLALSLLDTTSSTFHVLLFLITWILTSFVEFEESRLSALIRKAIINWATNSIGQLLLYLWEKSEYYNHDSTTAEWPRIILVVLLLLSFVKSYHDYSLRIRKIWLL